jgi:hypothetical protein
MGNHVSGAFPYWICPKLIPSHSPPLDSITLTQGVSASLYGGLPYSSVWQSTYCESFLLGEGIPSYADGPQNNQIPYLAHRDLVSMTSLDSSPENFFEPFGGAVYKL